MSGQDDTVQAIKSAFAAEPKSQSESKQVRPENVATKCIEVARKLIRSQQYGENGWVVIGYGKKWPWLFWLQHRVRHSEQRSTWIVLHARYHLGEDGRLYALKKPPANIRAPKDTWWGFKPHLVAKDLSGIPQTDLTEIYDALGELEKKLIA